MKNCRGLILFPVDKTPTPNRFFNILLEKFGLTNDFALSIELEVCQPSISRMRAGKEAINSKMILKVNERLGVDIKEILSWGAI